MNGFLKNIMKRFVHQPGSDHPIHVRVIKMIRRNGNKYSIKDVFTFDEYSTYYPFLYHWLLSFFFFKTAINSPHLIQWAINLLKLIFFNIFLYSIKLHYSFDVLDCFLLNLVYLTFPFSYTFWNAKNTGLSARGFGLMFGQIYVYFLYHYLLGNSDLLFFFLIVSSLLVILSSMMALQFITLSAPLISITFNEPEIFLIPLISYLLFFILFNQLAKNHFIGVLNYYKNYSKYFAEIFIFKHRPNIYRDFIKDFWIQLTNQKITTINKIKYIFLNPLIELIHGFPYLIIVICVLVAKGGDYGLIETKLIASVLFVFFLTTLNPLRFLGEPQRYIEFIIPIVAVFFVIKTTLTIQFFTASVLFIFIMLISFFTKNKKDGKPDIQLLLDYLDHNFNHKDVLISNDQDFLKYCSPILNIITTDTSKLIKSKSELLFFNKSYYGCLTPESLIHFSQKYKPKVLIVNKIMYSDEEMHHVLSKINCNKIIEHNDYLLLNIIPK